MTDNAKTAEQLQQDREILAAASKDSDGWDNATWAAWWRTAERHDPHFKRKVTTAAAVAAQGALPVPVGDQPQPWNDDRAVQVLSQAGAMCGVCGDEPGDRKCPDCESCRRDYLECLYGEAGWGPRAALLAEVEHLKAELASAREDAAFMERNTLPELRRTVEHHQAGKQRWRERAEKAEARVAELETERHTTNEALDDAVQALRESHAAPATDRAKEAAS
jgi:hypothetical protein